MFNNAYKGHLTVFAKIVNNLFPQNNIRINPIICDILFFVNILTTTKFTRITVHYFNWHESSKVSPRQFLCISRISLFLFGFFDNVNKSTGELSRTLLYLQYWKATARFQIYQYEDENNKGTVSIQLVVYSYTLFSYIRTYYNFSLDIPEMRYVFFSSTEDVYDTLFVSILFSFSLTRKWAFNARTSQYQFLWLMLQSLFSKGRFRRSFYQFLSPNHMLTP